MDHSTFDADTVASSVSDDHVVAGRYHVRARLGRGASKEVYLAYDERLDREVAIAIVAGTDGSDRARERAEREAQVTGRLGDHPHVVTVYDSGECGGVSYLVLRAMSGGSLAAALEHGRLALHDATRIAGQIAGALAHAHAHGVLHRDVKPDNVWLASDGSAALGDFGIASDQSTARLTAEGVVVGTVRYLSPEQIRGDEVGPASDLYSLGVTLYELVTGRVPFTAEHPAEILAQHLFVSPTAPSELDPTVPAELERLILELLAKQPEQRPGSAAEIERALACMTAAGDAPPGMPASVVCPFKGPASFDVEDAAYFCGRDRLVAELVGRLVGAPLLGILGPSGSGKSSVLRAGLLPALAGGALPGSAQWSQVLIRPGRDPLAELQRALRAAPGQPLVIAVDQFEELFTGCPDEAQRRAFAEALAAATRDRDARCKVVLALRADFYGRCAAYDELAGLLVANHVLVGPMDDDELREAIEGPARLARLRLEPELTTALVRDSAGEPGALPLLSSALLELWQQRDGRLLTYAAYGRSGGVRGAVARLAEDAYGRLDGEQQRIARAILTRLVGGGAGGPQERCRVDLDVLAGPGSEHVAAVVALLADRRILTVGSGAVELSHDALLREWPRLQGWIEEDRDAMRVLRNVGAAAREWERLGRDDDALYRGGRLAEARAWLASGDGVPSALEREFLACSDARARHERALRRGRGALFAAALALLLVALSVVVVTLVARDHEAEVLRELETAHELAMRSASLLESDPRLGRVLAVEAYDAAHTDEAESAVRQAMLEVRETAIRAPQGREMRSMTVGVDGRTAVTLDVRGRAQVWNVSRREARFSVSARDANWTAAAVDRDGLTVALARDDGTIVLAGVENRKRRDLTPVAGTYVPGGDRVTSLDFRGALLVAGSADGAIRLISAATGRPRLLGNVGRAPRRVQFSADGEKVVSVDGAGRVAIWDVATRDVVALDGGRGGFGDAAFAPRGDRLATVDGAGRLRISDRDDGQAVGAAVKIAEDGLRSVRFSRDGRRCVITATDGAVRVVDARDGLLVSEMHTAAGPLIGAAFVADGSVVSAGGDAGLRFWAPTQKHVLRTGPASIPGWLDDSRDAAGWIGADGAVHRWDLVTGGEQTLSARTARARLTRVSGDGTVSATVSDDRVHVRGGRATVLPGGAHASALALDHRGRRIAIGGRSPRIVRADGGGGTLMLRGRSGTVEALAFSRDGRKLATVAGDGTARLYETRTGRRLRTLRGTDAAKPTSIAYSHDGRRLAIAGVDGTIKVWLLADRDPTALFGHRRAVNSVAFTPDGTQLVSAGADGTVRLWDMPGARQLVVLERYERASGATFSSDGRRILSAGVELTSGLPVLRVSACDVCGPFADVLRLARSRAEERLSTRERARLQSVSEEIGRCPVSTKMSSPRRPAC